MASSASFSGVATNPGGALVNLLVKQLHPGNPDIVLADVPPGSSASFSGVADDKTTVRVKACDATLGCTVSGTGTIGVVVSVTGTVKQIPGNATLGAATANASNSGPFSFSVSAKDQGFEFDLS